MRGALSTKESGSSFAEAHKVLLSGPTHIESEDEVEDQENEVDDERDCEEYRVESRRERSNTAHDHRKHCDTVISAEKHEKMWRVRCSVHTSRRLQQIAISCKRSGYNKLKTSCQNSTLSSLMSKRPQQVCLFFDAAHSTSSEVIDFH